MNDESNGSDENSESSEATEPETNEPETSEAETSETVTREVDESSDSGSPSDSGVTSDTGETREVLTNPFQVGERVTIPAGTTYTTTNPTIRGRQKTKRAQTVTVDDTFPAFLVRTKSDRVLVRPLRIRTTGSGGYAKDINITEQIVRLNGKTPHYAPVPVDV
jgi:hypothetical protein